MSRPVRPCIKCGAAWQRGLGGGAWKLCPSCRQTHSWCSIGKHVVASGEAEAGQSRCRTCSLSSQIQRAKVNRDWSRAVRLAAGCVDCGYAESADALDFDHMPGTVKRFTIGLSMSRTRAVLEAEVAKCEVRCANCHRIKTAQRKQEI